MNPKISFVIPVKDEESSITILVQEIISVCKKLRKSFEIIFVDDGSTDKTFEKIKKLAKKNKNIRGYRLRSWFGKSLALSAGFAVAKGEIVITLDGDLQDDPNEAPKFLAKINEGFDLVSGWKEKREDPLTKTIPSLVINFLVRVLTGIKIHDINCGFKAYKKNVVKNLNLYGDLYRFIPILASREGFKITEVKVRHRPRKFGKSKYGPSRFLTGWLDLLTIFFLLRYLKRPGHFFGSIGVIFSFIGFAVCAYITYLRVTTGGIAFRYPLLLMGVLLLILGAQFIMTGLLGEMIIFFQKRERPQNFVEETTPKLL